MKYGLSDTVYNKIKNITIKYCKYNFKIYGSRARGDYKKESDIDIAIEGEVSVDDKINILNDFDLLDIPYMIDVVFINDLKKQELILSINREGIIYE